MNEAIENNFSGGNTIRFTRLSQLYQKYQEVKEKDNRREKWKAYLKEYDMLPTQLGDGRVDPNHGKFRRKIDNRVDIYVDIITERSRWASVQCYHGSPEEAAKYSRVITNAFHRFCIEMWTERHYNSYLDVWDMVMFGKGHEFFDRYHGCYPENVSATKVRPNLTAGQRSKDWDLLFIDSTITGVELYRKVFDDDIQAADGWNTDAVKRLLETNYTQSTDNDDEIDILRRGSGVSSSALNEEYKIVYAYVREYADKDGKSISRFVFPDSIYVNSDGNKTDEDVDAFGFLAEKYHFEESMTNIINVRTDTINADYYFSTSWADMNYFLCVFYNRSMNKIIRSVLRNLHLFLKSDNPDQEEKLSRIDPNKEVSVLDQDTDIVQQAVNVNWQGTLEVLRQVEFDTSSELRDKLSTGSQNVKGRAITAKEAEINLSQSESAINSAHKIFNMTDTDLINAIYARFVDPDRMVKGCPGYKGYQLFIEEMERLQIPEAAWDPENVIVESVLNFGSTNRREKFANATTLMQAIKAWSIASTEGEKRAAEDMVSAIVGRSNIHFYLPAEEEAKLQLTEMFRIGGENVDLNSQFTSPNNVVVNPERDNHILHASGHAQDMIYILQNAGAMIDQALELPMVMKAAKLERAAELVLAQQNKGAHIEAHMQIIRNASPDEAKPLDNMLAEVRKLHTKVAGELQQQMQALFQENQEQSFLTIKEQHEVRMMKIREEAAQNDIGMKALQQTVKGDLNREGAEINQEQKLRHKEQAHIQELTHKALQNIQERLADQAKMLQELQKENANEEEEG